MSDQQIPFGFSDENEAAASSEPHVFSVGELNKLIRDQLEGEFQLVWLRAEISNFKPHTSGHFYFSLKDDKSQISAVMFRGHASRLKFRPEDGMEVLVRGRVSVYEPRGTYQVYCELMEPVGLGALQKAFEQLKEKLKKEGLFDAAKKRALPAFPSRIAIVTSPTGAAIRDMLNVLGRRYRAAEVILIPCSVQGDAAPREIVAAIELANQVGGFDVMIVGRGGGSIEDLWAFNDERVARAIAASKIPTISAVGHEIDVTISDFVADLRAPTPSAAAELVVKSATEITERLALSQRRLRADAINLIVSRRRAVEMITRSLVDPKKRLQDLILRCDELVVRLEGAAVRGIEKRRMRAQLMRQKLTDPKKKVSDLKARLEKFSLRLETVTNKKIESKRSRSGQLAAVLDSLSPLKVVDRGYAIVTLKGAVVKDAKSLTIGEDVSVRVAKGEFSATVKMIKN